MELVILIEQLISYEDLPLWVNPKGKVKYRKLKNGIVKEIKPMCGEQIKKICDNWKEKYNLKFKFCEKKDSAKMILKLLGENYE